MNNAVMLWAVLNGLVGFLIFYLTFRSYGKKHGVRPEMWGAKTSVAELTKTFVLAATIFSFFFLLLFTVFALTGTVYWTDGWLYVNLLFAVVPIMFLLPYFNRYFFRLTGRIYLGPITMCLVFIALLLSNTVCYTPL